MWLEPGAGLSWLKQVNTNLYTSSSTCGNSSLLGSYPLLFINPDSAPVKFKGTMA